MDATDRSNRTSSLVNVGVAQGRRNVGTPDRNQGLGTDWSIETASHSALYSLPIIPVDGFPREPTHS